MTARKRRVSCTFKRENTREIRERIYPLPFSRPVGGTNDVGELIRSLPTVPCQSREKESSKARVPKIERPEENDPIPEEVVPSGAC